MEALIIKSLYFFLPAYIGNMAPIIFKKVPFLNKSINRRLFGPNKTWRGFILGVIFTTFIFWLQKVMYLRGFKEYALIDYADFSIMLGFLMGVGIMLGDAIESYYKRKQNIASGESWMPWDQLDFVFGGVLMGSFIYVPPAEVFLVLLIASPILHVTANYIGYILKMKKNKF
jgi:CDP-2,3-bis-(O-geranylgeranyl)-sn-glycerol synthase